ncbi:TPA: YSIRK-type signal peptide-containing protein, partial [Streptococcus suis]|nr:YSIRK-type signal peptide-containing protein [Streptococcus suis]
MNRSKKKSFDWYGMRQRFSIRKYHIGAASVLLGTTLVLGTGTIVSAETGVNGDGASNGQIVPVNNDGISDGTQPQGDNQGNNSSGVQTGNTTNSTANVQPAGDTGPASGQPVVNPRTMALTPEGDGLTNQPVAEPIMIIPSSATATAPQGYVTVTFAGNQYINGFTLGEQTGSSVQVFVKNGVTWGTLLDDPAWQWPTVKIKYPGDTVVGWAVNISYNGTYNPNNAFARDKYKDEVVTNTKLYPNVVYEVEDVGARTKEQYLALYGPDEQDKWIFIKFDAGQGSMTYDKTQHTSRSVAAYFKNIGYDNSQFTSKVVSPTLANHTFVRWQTDAGEVLPKSGPITTETTYEALYLAHPQNQVAVFDSKKLTDSEKEQVKKNILDANPNLSTGVPQVIKAIDISDTGEATVTFNDDTAVKVPSATLTNEDKDAAKSNAKAEIEKDAMEKSAAINASNLTEEEKREKLDEVNNAKAAADSAIDQASTSDEL